MQLFNIKKFHIKTRGTFDEEKNEQLNKKLNEKLNTKLYEKLNEE